MDELQLKLSTKDVFMNKAGGGVYGGKIDYVS